MLLLPPFAPPQHQLLLILGSSSLRGDTL
ncbi:hypothetical protein J437_LFUL011219 [Ladona fulva]|uniref:Uncharacterized protein n=1 Tax=Ladona fulva TaxID=123851 RepID=A0A8K0P650_LADFU|nr:hypothetical protein J437_LFUL011219 [Ladona fulva]